VFKKNITDGVRSQNESIDTPLYPPLFWLDNIFNYVTILLTTRLSMAMSTMEKDEKNMHEDCVAPINLQRKACREQSSHK
jgi:hypothetical protein